VKISAPTNPNLGWNTPFLYMESTRQRIKQESCSNPLWIGKDFKFGLKKKIFNVQFRPFWSCLQNHRMFRQVCQNNPWCQRPVGVQKSSRITATKPHEIYMHS